MKALHKDIVLQIKHTWKRFLSILLMALLGVGFFAGIKATSPDMKDTLDVYFDEQNIFDIEVVSTLGIVQKDIDAISQIAEIEKILPTYSTDLEFNIGQNDIIVKAYSYFTDEINQPQLQDGKLPEKENECVVESNFLKATGLQIGDKIVAENFDEDGILNTDTFQIVGTVSSPLYISRERGSTKLGDGMLDYFMYIWNGSFSSEAYTEIYLTIAGTKELNTFSDAYENKIETVKSQLEEIATIREEGRYQEILTEANEEIAENEKKLEDAKTEANQKIADAEQEIKDGESKIAKAEKEIKNNRAEANNKFMQAEAEIAQAEKELTEKEQEFNNSKESIQEQIAQAKTAIDTLNSNMEKIEEQIIAVNKQYEGVTDETALAQKETILAQLNASKEQISSQLNEITTQLESAQQILENTPKQLAAGKEEIQKNKQELTKNKNSTYQQLNNAENQVNTSKQEIAEAKETLEEERIKAEEEIADAEQKLAEAKEEINKIEKPTWYILDRESNTGYEGYHQDTQRIANIGKLFPVVFFVVATLISLTSMTRMVEEQRVQIGTLKALGYHKNQIIQKYILYALTATLIGGVIGMIIGFELLPRIIFSMYKMMYANLQINIQFNLYYGAMGLGIAIACIVGATIVSAMNELKRTPAELMRPKAPKPGKRVILEKIPILWKHMNFTQKVTARNLFRYKKRFLMTIIGICGCTALILAGFGLKNSISSMIPLQYGEIFRYQMLVSLKSDITKEQIQEKVNDLQNYPEITDLLKVNMQSGTLTTKESKDVQILIPEDNTRLEDFILLRKNGTKEYYHLSNNEIIITQKVAKLLNIKSGDIVKLKNADDQEVEIKVQAITENYISHYVYMANSLYQELFHSVPQENVILIKTDLLTTTQEENLAKVILGDTEHIAGISKNSNLISLMDDTMKSLNSVVWVLIISAGLLAFVVLYNLSNVNISERVRELATIKVLGFYDKEVYDYVAKETTILTVIGIVLGLVGGYFLNLFIIETCELDMIMFNKIVEPISYLYATIITIVFTIIVNITTYFRLKKIDMIESLKSIE